MQNSVEYYAEIGKIKARDDDFTKEAQKILSMVNNITTRLNTIEIEEACHNNFGRISSDFTSINASIEAFQNEIIQHYTGQQSVTNQSETSS